MESLYQEALRLLSESQRQTHELVSVTSGVESEQALETKAWENLNQLEQDCFRLKNMSRKEPPSRRQDAIFRVDQLTADFKAVQNAYRNYQHRKLAAEQDAKQREELLSRRFTANSSEDDASIHVTIDHSVQHHQRLEEANRGLDHLISHGSSIMGNLQGQRLTLKGAQRKLLDLANTFGLSNTVMRLIEKRTAQDWWIFWTGIAVTVTIICLLIYYFIL